VHALQASRCPILGNTTRATLRSALGMHEVTRENLVLDELLAAKFLAFPNSPPLACVNGERETLVP